MFARDSKYLLQNKKDKTYGVNLTDRLHNEDFECSGVLDTSREGVLKESQTMFRYVALEEGHIINMAPDGAYEEVDDSGRGERGMQRPFATKLSLASPLGIQREPKKCMY